MTDFILRRDDAPDLSYTYIPGERDLCVLYLHGWISQRKRPKGDAIARAAQAAGCSYLALDYTGHGASGGQPADFTIGQGIRDVRDVIEATVGDSPLVIVGNSIGGWIGLWLAEHLPTVRGVLGLAPAPDITQLIWDKLLSETAKDTLKRGEIVGPSSETQGFCFTKQLFDDAADHFMLNREIDFSGPVYLIIGDRDNQVGFDRILKIKDNLKSDWVTVIQVKGADHHLSRDTDLALIRDISGNLIQEVL